MERRQIFLTVVIGAQLIVAVYGIFDHVAPPEIKRLITLPKGIAIALAVISFSMAALSAHAVLESMARTKESEIARQQSEELVKAAQLCSAVHESEYFITWPAQFKSAKYKVDITHLARNPPYLGKHTSEGEYFRDFKGLVKGSPAQVRRVERLTVEKIEWIEKLIAGLKGANNFSLAIFDDPFPGEMGYIDIVLGTFELSRPLNYVRRCMSPNTS